MFRGHRAQCPASLSQMWPLGEVRGKESWSPPLAHVPTGFLRACACGPNLSHLLDPWETHDSFTHPWTGPSGRTVLGVKLANPGVPTLHGVGWREELQPPSVSPPRKAFPEQLPVSSRLAPPLWSNPVWVGRPGVSTCLLLFPGLLAVCRCGALARRSPIRAQRTGVERGGEPRSLEGPEAKYWAVSLEGSFP